MKKEKEMEMEKEMYQTKGKNKQLLKGIKKELNENLREYFKLKSKSVRVMFEKKLGALFLKLAELATIRYNWNRTFSKTRYLDIDNIKGEITLKLWEIISSKKFKLNRLKNENSVYNFFMCSANNAAYYEVRKEMRREGLIRFDSLEQVLSCGNKYGNESDDKSFNSGRDFPQEMVNIFTKEGMKKEDDIN